jgi:hypothetical protein
MGFECTYKIDTRYNVEELYQLLRTNLPFVSGWRDYDGRFQRMIFTEQEGLQITIYETIRPDITQHLYDFRPTVTVTFELARGDDPGIEVGLDNLRRSVNWLQNNVEGDAVFLANRDTPVLLRRGGVTWLDSRRTFWRDQDLALLTFPYEWKLLRENPD